MGYGSRALQALNSYYSGEFFNLEEETAPEAAYPDPSFVDEVKKTLFTFISNISEYTTHNFLTSLLTFSLIHLPFVRQTPCHPYFRG